MAGVPLNTGSCDQMLADLMAKNRFFTTEPRPGDIIIFDWDRNDGDPSEHVGIVESVTRGSRGETVVNTIEGNTSNAVLRRVRTHGSSDIVGYGRLT
jgi:hypothetical protein